MIFNRTEVMFEKGKYKYEPTGEEIYIPHSAELSRYQLAKLRRSNGFPIALPILRSIGFATMLGVVLALISWGYSTSTYAAGGTTTVDTVFIIVNSISGLGFLCGALYELRFMYKQLRTKRTRTDGIETINLENDPRINELWCAILAHFKAKGDHIPAYKMWGKIKDELRNDTALGHSFDNVISGYLDSTWDQFDAFMFGQSFEYQGLLRQKMREKACEILPTLLEMYEEDRKVFEAAKKRAEDEAEKQRLLDQKKIDAEAEVNLAEHTRSAEIRARAALGLGNPIS